MSYCESKAFSPDSPPCARKIRDVIDLRSHFSVVAEPIGSLIPAPGENAIRIALADEEIMFREGLRVYLQMAGRFDVVGASADGDTTINLVRSLEPDVLLLDFGILLHQDIDLLREINESKVDVKVILLCHTFSKSDIVRALQLGVRGMVLKTDPPDFLIECIHKVIEGEYCLGKRGVTTLVQAVCEPDTSSHLKNNKYGLTRRECEIVDAVLEGCSNPEIAASLSVSEQTVKHHLSHIFDKLGVYSRLELALFAVNHGIGPE